MLSVIRFPHNATVDDRDESCFLVSDGKGPQHYLFRRHRAHAQGNVMFFLLVKEFKNQSKMWKYCYQYLLTVNLERTSEYGAAAHSVLGLQFASRYTSY